jgi:hypothetical protein
MSDVRLHALVLGDDPPTLMATGGWTGSWEHPRGRVAGRSRSRPPHDPARFDGLVLAAPARTGRSEGSGAFADRCRSNYPAAVDQFHGTADAIVPIEISRRLAELLRDAELVGSKAPVTCRR